MFRALALGLVLLCAESQSTSIIARRQSTIYHEPPVESDGKVDEKIEAHWIVQPVDHFNHQDKRTFTMRYLSNRRFYQPGGPLFIVIGGEWEIGPAHISAGRHIYDLAVEFGACLVYTEHRFYGQTWPFKTVSTENLRYLSVDQSLADLASAVQAITMGGTLGYNFTGGVIVQGGSYGASMATWFRQKYPHLVNGAWASSGPLNAKLNYVEYMETVGRSMRKIGGEDCYSALETAFKALDEILESQNVDALSKLFGVCPGFKIDRQIEVWNFYSTVKNIFSGIVQRHSDGHIESYCRELTSRPWDVNHPELRALAAIFRRELGVTDCITFDYDADIRQLREVDTELARNFRPWYYQTCSEFGWYQTTGSANQPFGTKSPLRFDLETCVNVFGDVFKDLPTGRYMQHTNAIYGAFKPGVSNVYFTHGSLDPWHPMGVLSDLNENAPSVMINGISHCRDMNSINYAKDSPQLIESKKTIRKLIAKWLKQ